MPDKNTVMRWLEICGKNGDCSGTCPYQCRGNDEFNCLENLMANALELLKEQGPKTVLKMEKYVASGLIVGVCPSCKEKILTTKDNPTRFCKYCGQAVKWE